MKRCLLLVGSFFVFMFLCAAETARDWSEIYLGINPSVSPDGSFFAFEWKDRVWLAPTEGGVATPIGDGMSADTTSLPRRLWRSSTICSARGLDLTRSSLRWNAISAASSHLE